MPLLVNALLVASGLALAAIGTGRALAATDPLSVLAVPTRPPGLARALAPAWRILAAVAERLTPGFWAARMRRHATLAGLADARGVLSAKTLAAGCAATWFWVLGSPFTALVAAAAGFLAPDVWLARRGARRQEELRRDLPEALDLMAIAVGAGTGLEAAMALVSDRVAGPLGSELRRVLQEVQLGVSRRDALRNLRDRTDVREFSTFVLALVQADALGTPVGDVLRTQAAEMRMLRRQRAREEAAKTPVKLLVPLLLGIFPALGIVIMGPAVIQIARAFSG